MCIIKSHYSMRVEYEKEEKIGITFLTINSLRKLLIVTALSNSILFSIFAGKKMNLPNP